MTLPAESATFDVASATIGAESEVDGLTESGAVPAAADPLLEEDDTLDLEVVLLTGAPPGEEATPEAVDEPPSDGFVAAFVGARAELDVKGDDAPADVDADPAGELPELEPDGDDEPADVEPNPLPPPADDEPDLLEKFVRCLNAPIDGSHAGNSSSAVRSIATPPSASAMFRRSSRPIGLKASGV